MFPCQALLPRHTAALIRRPTACEDGGPAVEMSRARAGQSACNQPTQPVLCSRFPLPAFYTLDGKRKPETPSASSQTHLSINHR